MRRKLALACLSLAAALALGVTAALAGTVGGASDPGVTSTSILLGGTSPLTGASSAYASVARGADAYFKYVNARGGVLGRTISYKVVDDAYNPAQSVQATRQLVEQEKVFAVFNSVGTEQNLAVRDYLNTSKVPQLFVASGATTWGRDYARYPYTIGFQPSYQAEGWVYGKYLARTAPGARVAVLFQNDDYGKDLLNGLKKGIQRSAVKVIAAQPYEATAADVGSQMARLKASGADTLAIFADAEVRRPGVRAREQARLEAEARDQQRGLLRLERDAARLRRRRQQGRRRRALDRLPQGPDRPAVEEATPP